MLKRLVILLKEQVLSMSINSSNYFMMKLIGLLVIVSLAFVSCKTKCDNDVQIKRDCTGTYLRVDNKDYKVCNKGVVDAFKDNAIVEAKYKHLSSCSSEQEPLCQKTHQSYGWVEVLEIK